MNVHVLQNLETALAGGLGQMSLVSDYQTFQPNLGSSSVIVRYRDGDLYTGGGGAGEKAISHHALYLTTTDEDPRLG